MVLSHNKTKGEKVEILKKYGRFNYARSLTTNDKIILVDEPLSREKRQGLENLKTADNEKLLFLEDKDLAGALEEILGEIIEKEQDTLLVFPGNGSNYPKKLSRICQQFPNAASIYAKRFWVPGSNPVVEVGTILPEIFLNLKVKTIVVIDDVVSSGLTMQKIHHKNAWRFPAAKWVGASWVSQIPQMKTDSGINGYTRVETVCVVGKTNGSKVPINSLSTLRKDPEIVMSYATRHFKNFQEFLHLISR